MFACASPWGEKMTSARSSTHHFIFVGCLVFRTFSKVIVGLHFHTPPSVAAIWGKLSLDYAKGSRSQDGGFIANRQPGNGRGLALCGRRKPIQSDASASAAGVAGRRRIVGLQLPAGRRAAGLRRHVSEAGWDSSGGRLFSLQLGLSTLAKLYNPFVFLI